MHVVSVTLSREQNTTKSNAINSVLVQAGRRVGSLNADLDPSKKIWRPGDMLNDLPELQLEIMLSYRGQ